MTSHGSIEPDKDAIREEPYSLPQGFSWDTLDLGDPAVVREVEWHMKQYLGIQSFSIKIIIYNSYDHF